MRLVSATFAAVVAVLVLAAGLPVSADGAPDSFAYGGEVTAAGVTDSSGLNNVGVISATYGGTVTQATNSTYSPVLRFPEAICTTAPKGSSCPRATVTPADQSALNPLDGTGDFEFGATVRLSTASGTAGMNIIQRGNFGAGQAQWKLQTDYRSVIGGRVASCRFADTVRSTLIFGTKSLTADTWYTLSCKRTGSVFSLTVDQVDGSTADETISIQAPISAINPTKPAVIGAKSIVAVVGQTDKNNDQFHGDLDAVFFRRG